jgi:hypothetical protein
MSQAGLFAAAFATIAAHTDEADLVDRQTVPSSDELTIAERASFKSDFTDTPSPGTPFTNKIK